MKARFGQGGSVASFIIIGVVLVLVTTGILYWVQHKDTPPARDETPVVVAPETEKSPSQEEAPADTTDETSPPATSTPAPTGETPSAVTQPTVTTLSQTGPSETALQLLATGALVAAAAGFMRSRKLRSSL